MADSRFFHKSDPLTLREVIELTGAKCSVNHDLNSILIQDVSPLETADSTKLSFLVNSKYIETLKTSEAGFCFIQDKYAKYAPQSMIQLIHPNPYKAYAIVANKFYPDIRKSNHIEPSASISSNCQIGKNCYIGNFVVIEENVTIGDNSYIDHNSVIKKNVAIGKNVKIASNVTISHAVIGDDVIIHPGVRIGQDGFGFASDHTGHMKVPQLGIVKIGNKVEIGANTTIDRGSSQNTEIGDMCQIDNLVQLGHNVKLGMGCVIVAQVGIAGSTRLGNFTVLGGQVGVAGHLNIGNQVQIAAQSGVTKDISDNQIMGGYPAVPVRQWHKQTLLLKKLCLKE